MEFLNPLRCEKRSYKAGCNVRLSYKKGLKFTVLTLISTHQTIKIIPSSPQSLEVFGRVSSPWGYFDIWLKRLVSLKRVQFSGLVSKLEYNFYQSVF